MCLLFSLAAVYTQDDPYTMDSDGDGYTDGEESDGGYDPNDPGNYPGYEYSIDTDGDGYSDYDENSQGTDPNDSASYPGYVDDSYYDDPGNDPYTVDSDSDGYTDGEESDAGSDPYDSGSYPGYSPDYTMDSDSDGWTDADEASYGTDPNDPSSYPYSGYDTDSDGDGYSDADEGSQGTNPNDPNDYPGSYDPYSTDSDGDGYNDYDESSQGNDPNDPNNYPGWEYMVDSDGDGYSDGEEMNSGYDPNDPSVYPGHEMSTDSDGDGHSDYDENMAGTDPYDSSSFPGNTYDSDGDGWSDWDEQEAGSDEFDPASTPETIATDTDNDGLTDGFESDLGTDPNNPDTDGDNLTDGAEVNGVVVTIEVDENGSTWATQSIHTLDPLDTDTDNDLLEDGWEAANNFHPDYAGDGLADDDGDGLTVGQEIAIHGTDITTKDSDLDGEWDGEEVIAGTDPLNQLSRTSADADGDVMSDAWEDQYTFLDSAVGDDASTDHDGDGLSNLREYLCRVDPDDTDSDDDGYEDGFEFDNGFDPGDPSDANRDSDNDGMSDLWELTYGLDPTDDSDKSSDLDGDLLEAVDEFAAGFRPDLADTDNDGESDYAELFGFDPSETDSDGDWLSDADEIGTHGTDPNLADTDGDGLSDFVEIHGVAIQVETDSGTVNRSFVTDPILADTDDDGMEDLFEINNLFDPTMQSDGLDDEDGDTLSNAAELVTYGTDWNNADTDEDGESDSLELAQGSDPLDPDSNELDTDGDLMRDSWEIEHQLNTNNPADASLDLDEDGLTNLEEFQNDTNPHVADSDQDGYKDGFEVAHGFDPALQSDGTLSTDGDVMPDLWEITYNLLPDSTDDVTGDLDNDNLENAEEFLASTRPDLSDTDNDGLTDSVELWTVWEYEVDGTTVTYSTDPLDPDSDNDLLPDGLEITEEMHAGDPADGAEDYDSDNLGNGAEYATHNTDWKKADTDGDGESDGYEITQETNPLDILSRTSVDSDGDHMSDEWEAFKGTEVGTADGNLDPDNDGLNHYGEYLAGTEPFDPDTDGDDYKDGFERTHGYDPLDPVDATLDSDNDNLPDLWEITYGLPSHNPDHESDDPDDDGVLNIDELTNSTSPISDDTDGDGLPDDEEIAGAGSLEESEGVFIVWEYAVRADLDDTDNDLQSDYDEILHGSDPTDGSSTYNAPEGDDGSGTSQAPTATTLTDTGRDSSTSESNGTDNTSGGTNPDSSGSADRFEGGVENRGDSGISSGFITGATSLDDSDGDGYTDAQEISDGTDPDDGTSYASHLTEAEDADRDGIADAWEIEHKLDPTDPEDAWRDYDYDLISNIQEYQLGLDPFGTWNLQFLPILEESIRDDSLNISNPNSTLGSLNDFSHMVGFAKDDEGWFWTTWDGAEWASANPLPITRSITWIGDVVQNNFGLVAFEGIIQGSVDEANRAFLFILEPDGKLSQLGLESGWREISDLHITDSGFVAGRAIYRSETDGQRVFRWRNGDFRLFDQQVEASVIGLAEDGTILDENAGRYDGSAWNPAGNKPVLTRYGGVVQAKDWPASAYGYERYQTASDREEVVSGVRGFSYHPEIAGRNAVVESTVGPLLITEGGTFSFSKIPEEQSVIAGIEGSFVFSSEGDGEFFPFEDNQDGNISSYWVDFDDDDDGYWDDLENLVGTLTDDPLDFPGAESDLIVNDSNRNGDFVGWVADSELHPVLGSQYPELPHNEAYLWQYSEFTFLGGADYLWKINDTGALVSSAFELEPIRQLITNSEGVEEFIETGLTELNENFSVHSPANDVDLDGMPDDWEAYHAVTEPDLDPDGDGLTNAAEFVFRTSPNFADTDGDTLSDKFEIENGLNPRSAHPSVDEDVDGDSLNWFEEAIAGSDPLLADTDWDGIPDADDDDHGTPFDRFPAVVDPIDPGANLTDVDTPRPVDWIQFVNTTDRGSEHYGVRKAAGGTGWNGFAAGSRCLHENGELSFVIEHADFRAKIGWQDNGNDPLNSDLAVGLSFLPGGMFETIDWLSAVPTPGVYAVGDKFSIQRLEDTVLIFQNDELIHSVVDSESTAWTPKRVVYLPFGQSADAHLSDVKIAGGVLDGDIDEDGLPDDWEVENLVASLSSSGAMEPSVIMDAAGPMEDADNDGVSNLNEFLTGTDPTDATKFFQATPINWDWNPGSAMQETVVENEVQALRKISDNLNWDQVAVSSISIEPWVDLLEDYEVSFSVGALQNFAFGFGSDFGQYTSRVEMDFGLVFEGNGEFVLSAPNISSEEFGALPDSGTPQEYRYGDQFTIRVDAFELDDILTEWTDDTGVTQYESQPHPLKDAGFDYGVRYVVLRNGVLISSHEMGLSISDGIRVTVFLAGNATTPSILAPRFNLDQGNPALVDPNDRDGDGLPDKFEWDITGFDRTDEFESIVHINPDDDFDGDGSSNLEEYLNRSDPTNSDDHHRFVPVRWTDMQFVDEAPWLTLDPATLRKSSGGSTNLGGASSEQVLDIYGAARFLVREYDEFSVGLYETNGSALWDNLELSLRFSEDGTYKVFEGDSEHMPQQVHPLNLPGIYDPGDEFAFEGHNRDGGFYIRIWHDDDIVYQYYAGEAGNFRLGANITDENEFPVISKVEITSDETVDRIFTDLDRDGMEDSWERLHFIDVVPPIFASIEDVIGWKDQDADGKSNFQEYLDWTDPNDPGQSRVFKSILWKDHVLTDSGKPTLFGSGLRKTVDVSAWDAGARGSRLITGNGADGGIQFVANGPGAMAVGLSSSNSTVDPNDVDYGFKLYEDGSYEVLFGGVAVTPSLGQPAIYYYRDTFGVELIGSEMRYFQNGKLIHSDIPTTTEPLFADASLHEFSYENQISRTRIFGGAIPGDMDEDGLPDVWENEKIIEVDTDDSFSDITHVQPFTDFDGDGATDYAEWVDDTDPADPLDFFAPVQWNTVELATSDILPGKSAGSIVKNQSGNTGIAFSKKIVGLAVDLGHTAEVRFDVPRLDREVTIGLAANPDYTEAEPTITGGHVILNRMTIHGDGSSGSVYARNTTDNELSLAQSLTIAPGDTFAIRRTGDSVEYIQNDQVVSTLSLGDVAGLEGFHVYVTSSYNGGELRNLRSRHFYRIGDLDGDGVDDAIEQEFIDSNLDDDFIDLSDVDLSTDLDGRSAREVMRFGEDHYSNDPLLAVGNDEDEDSWITPPTSVQNDTIRSINGSFGVGAGGAAEYSIPIPLPKGTRGMVPSLSLDYSSHAGNGLLGVGWSLSGFSSITRGPSQVLQDGRYDPVDFDENDRFYYGGSKLILVDGVYGENNSEYRTEIDTFSRFRFFVTGGDSRWEVHTKSGNILHFGSTENSRLRRASVLMESETGQTWVTSGITRWGLARKEDRLGNYCEYEYQQIGELGHVAEFLPAYVRYTGNENAGLAPYSEVTFVMEDRPSDTVHGYKAGGQLSSTKRLKEIFIRTDGHLNRRWLLHYHDSPNTFRTRLTGVQEFNSVGETYEPTRFVWQEFTPGWDMDPKWNVPALVDVDYGETGRRLVDLNGDGLVDIVWRHALLRDKFTEGAFLNTGNGFEAAPQFRLPAVLSTHHGETGTQIVDLNGDTLPDLISSGSFENYEIYGTRTKKLTLKRGVGESENAIINKWPRKVHKREKVYRYYMVEPDEETGFRDWVERTYTAEKSEKLNGIWIPNPYPPLETRTKSVNDTREFSHAHEAGAWINTGNGWRAAPEFAPPIDLADGTKEDTGVRFVDLDNNGFIDLVKSRTSSGGTENMVFLNDGTGWEDVSGGDWDLPTHLAIDDGEISQGRIIADINGDDLPDLLYSNIDTSDGFPYDAETKVWLNNGEGWDDVSAQWIVPAWFSDDQGKSYGRFLEDVNSDGILDIIVSEKWNESVPWVNQASGIYLGTGAGWEMSSDWKLPHAHDMVEFDENGEAKSLGKMLADVNGDGRVDFISATECEKQGVYLNTGSGWTKNAGEWKVPAGCDPQDEESFKLQLVDVNGDGFVDFVDRNNSEVWLNQAKVERISEFRAPRTDPILVEYKRLNDHEEIPELGQRVYTQGVGSVYPYLDLQSSRSVVSKVTSIDNQLRAHSTAYRYGELRFDQRGHGSMGFRWRETYDLVRGGSSRTEFRQEFPFTGLPTLTESRLPDGRVVGRTVTYYDKNASRGGLPNGGGTIETPYVKATIASSYQVDSSMSQLIHVATTKTWSNYDDFGSVDDTTVELYATDAINTNSVPLKVTYTDHEYGENNEEDWLIGRPTRTEVKVTSNESDLEGDAERTRVATTSYDPATGLRQTTTSMLGTPWQSTSVFGRDAFGNIETTSVTAAGQAGVRSSGTYYDPTGRFLVRSVNGFGHEVSTSYLTERGLPHATLDANGHLTTFLYDTWGVLTKTSLPDGTKSVAVTKEIRSSSIPGVEYYTFAQTTGGPPQLTYYDRYGRTLLTESTGFDGRKIYTEAQFDDWGRQTASSLPYWDSEPVLWAKTHYDSLDRVVAIESPDGRTSSITVNGFQSVEVDALGHTRTTITDTFGRERKILDNLGQETCFFFDVDGNLARTVDVAGNVTTAQFNLLGKKASGSEPNFGNTTLTYSGFGELKTSLDSAGNLTEFEYDVLGRKVRQETTEATTTYQYDTAPRGSGEVAIGALASVSLTPKSIGANLHHPHGVGYSESYTYDELGRTLSKTFTAEGKSYITSTSYDGLGRVDRVTSPKLVTDPAEGFIVEHSYTKFGSLYRRSRVVDGGTELLWEAAAFDSHGRLTQFKNGNGVVETQTHGATTGFLTSNLATNTAGETIQNFSYSYDAVGNVLSRTANHLPSDVNNAASPPITESFTYDALKRLKTISGPSGNQTLNYRSASGGDLENHGNISTYYYNDTIANRLDSTVDLDGVVRDYIYDSLGRVVQEERDGNLWRGYSWTSFGKPRVMDHYSGPVLIGNDDAGATRQLIQARFVYDAHSNRQAKYLLKDGKVKRTLYLGSVEIVETRIYEVNVDFGLSEFVGRSTKYHFGNGEFVEVDVPDATTENDTDSTFSHSQTVFFHRDNLGSISTITDSAGEAIEHMSFASFGMRRNGATWEADSATGDDASSKRLEGENTNRGYTGHEQLDDFQLIHMNGRIYDPEIGRFLAPDPFVAKPGNSQSYNRYAYVMNNPHRYTDPSGYFIRSIAGFMSAIFSTVVNFIGNLFGGMGGGGRGLNHGSAVRSTMDFAYEQSALAGGGGERLSARVSGGSLSLRLVSAGGHQVTVNHSKGDQPRKTVLYDLIPAQNVASTFETPAPGSEPLVFSDSDSGGAEEERLSGEGEGVVFVESLLTYGNDGTVHVNDLLEYGRRNPNQNIASHSGNESLAQWIRLGQDQYHGIGGLAGSALGARQRGYLDEQGFLHSSFCMSCHDSTNPVAVLRRDAAFQGNAWEIFYADTAITVASLATGGLRGPKIVVPNSVVGYKAGQGFSGVFDAKSGRVLFRPSSYDEVLPDGWVPAKGGHVNVFDELGSDLADSSGFTVFKQADGSLSVQWKSGLNLTDADDMILPFQKREPILKALENVTGRTAVSE